MSEQILEVIRLAKYNVRAPTETPMSSYSKHYTRTVQYVPC